MDRNLLLAVTLSILVLLGWSMLQGGGKRPRPAPGEEPATAEAPLPPTSTEPGPAPAASEMAAAPPAPAQPPPPAPAVTASERILRVERPLYEAELTSRGGALRRWQLSAESGYHEGKRAGGGPIVLTTGEPPHGLTLVTPLTELGLGDLAQAVFEVEEEDALRVVFRYSAGGVTVRKRYEFGDDSYTFRLGLEITNGSAAPISPAFGVQWPAHRYDAADFTEQALAALHNASVVKKQIAQLGRAGFLGSFTGKTASLREPFEREIDWAGVQTTYFLGVLLPDSPSQANAAFVTTEPGKAGYTEVSFGEVTIPPGQGVLKEFRGYAGPKEVDRLVALGGETIRSIDLGWSWVSPLTRFFGTLLRALVKILPGHNYGVAIILLTILVRVVTIPLTQKQMRSMERMRALQPKIKELQAKHADDRQKQSEAMMSLYKTEKVNPLGGCLPMVLQLPVFIGLFYALRSSIQLRQAPFFGWIDDLSTPETLFVLPGLDLPVRLLPLLMGASMFVQQKLTPMQADPAQARMMMIVMPIMMTVLFYSFPSGLVLYWMVSNILAISHQTWVGRRMKQA